LLYYNKNNTKHKIDLDGINTYYEKVINFFSGNIQHSNNILLIGKEN